MSALSCLVVGIGAALVHVLSCIIWDKSPGTFVCNKQPLSCHDAGVVSMDKQLPLQNCIAPGCLIFIGTCSQFFSHFLSPICLLRTSAPHYFKHFPDRPVSHGNTDVNHLSSAGPINSFTPTGGNQWEYRDTELSPGLALLPEITEEMLTYWERGNPSMEKPEGKGGSDSCCVPRWVP